MNILFKLKKTTTFFYLLSKLSLLVSETRPVSLANKFPDIIKIVMIFL